MILTSPSFENNELIPRKFTCDGGDINPELQIQNVPSGTKSLALMLHDPDAPIAGGFTHWLVWNIDSRTTLIKEESIPPGAVEGINSSKNPGYMGPCPPNGTHHYEFHLYALDTLLDISEESAEFEFKSAIEKHILAEAVLVGLYAR